MSLLPETWRHQFCRHARMGSHVSHQLFLTSAECDVITCIGRVTGWRRQLYRHIPLNLTWLLVILFEFRQLFFFCCNRIFGTKNVDVPKIIDRTVGWYVGARSKVLYGLKVLLFKGIVPRNLFTRFFHGSALQYRPRFWGLNVSIFFSCSRLFSKNDAHHWCRRQSQCSNSSDEDSVQTNSESLANNQCRLRQRYCRNSVVSNNAIKVLALSETEWALQDNAKFALALSQTALKPTRPETALSRFKKISTNSALATTLRYCSISAVSDNAKVALVLSPSTLRLHQCCLQQR
jgi:hypothetical protein